MNQPAEGLVDLRELKVLNQVGQDQQLALPVKEHLPHVKQMLCLGDDMALGRVVLRCKCDSFTMVTLPPVLV